MIRSEIKKTIYKYSKTLKESDVLALYRDAKWSSYTNDVPKLMQAIANSLMIITAWEGEQLVGLIRVIGDGSVILYIQDILVLTEYKRKGIGTKLLKLILDEYKDVRQKVLLTQDSAETVIFMNHLASSRAMMGCLLRLPFRVNEILRSDKTMTTYYLVRHGEPDWELNERHGLKGHGRDLPPLTEIGILQAKKVSLDKRLQDSQIIICSPYTRAMHTADIPNCSVFELVK